MRILVNGVHLYFDVEGAGLVPAGETMRQKPTLLLLHGGPGVDHSLYKPAFSQLADVAQVVYLDHRGNGRSDRASPDTWTMSQWADDVYGFCQALEITKPVVYGASFGGMVAMAYAIRYPLHPGKLVLVSTAAQATSHAEAKLAMFAQLGGSPARELARRRFIDGDTSPELLQEWLRIALPLYTIKRGDETAAKRMIRNPQVTAWFNRPGGEGLALDLLPDLKRIQCPTLLLGGKLDPMLPIECQRDIAAAINPEILQYREYENCGHAVVPDCPEEAMALLRGFLPDAPIQANTGSA